MGKVLSQQQIGQYYEPGFIALIDVTPQEVLNVPVTALPVLA